MYYRGVEVTTQDIDGLLNTIYKFNFERTEKQEDKKKEQLEYRKYAAQATIMVLESE